MTKRLSTSSAPPKSRPKRPKASGRRNARRRQPKSRWRSLLRWPSWAVWLGGGTILAAYAFVFYYFFVSPYSFRWKGMYGEPSFPDGYSIHGIDVSHHQGDIDWARLRNASIDGTPVRFVIIKATEGCNFLDENFNENFFQAGENNLIRGAYHYFRPNVSAQRQAEYFLKQVHLVDGDFPPVLDIEERGTLTPAQLREAAKTWLRIVERRYGVKPIIYTGYSFKTTYLDDKELDEYPYWIAHYYVKELKYKGRWRLWQHTDAGRVDGIRGHVDLNVYNGSMYELQKFTIGGQTAEQPYPQLYD